MDLSAILWTALLVIVAIAVLSDIGVLLGKFIVEPLAHYFQRRVLGIDRALAGPEIMIGASARVTRVIEERTGAEFSGYVIIHGEEWAAVCEDPLSPGNMVTITQRVDLTLRVEHHEVGEL